ncbi:hypothetical protein FSC37_04565 [Piscinibacter aquaticus]|uniref:Uncharacterized protein n=1 Tax=Piscinibacter aquaticus TaxID=392597 RepID=A0A5C6TZ11_9BURK|nr:hypothetical protein FSC37_04565 [Piscinibacter aquaticus]
MIAAYALARWALQRDRAAAQRTAPDSAPARLDPAALGEIGLRLRDAVTGAPSLQSAVLAATNILRAELGSREATVHRVHAVSPPFVDLITVTVDGLPGIEHRVRLERSPLGEAVREGRVAGPGGGPFAIPVRGADAGWAWLIELGPVALQAEPGGLEALFERLAVHLAQLARADAPAQATLGDSRRDILTPGSGAQAMPCWAQGADCRHNTLKQLSRPTPCLQPPCLSLRRPRPRLPNSTPRPWRVCASSIRRARIS